MQLQASLAYVPVQSFFCFEVVVRHRRTLWRSHRFDIRLAAARSAWGPKWAVLMPMCWLTHACFVCVLLQYSFSLTTFSPSGKLVQIEYALNAVAAGATSLGISATDGVVIATEKKLPSILVDESTVQKIAVLTPNIGMVYSGMGPDYRVLVRKARKTAQAYHRLYNEHIPVAQLVRETAAVMQEFTREYNTQRPLLHAGHGSGWQATYVSFQVT